jgi:hypothetical protein
LPAVPARVVPAAPRAGLEDEADALGGDDPLAAGRGVDDVDPDGAMASALQLPA